MSIHIVLRLSPIHAASPLFYGRNALFFLQVIAESLSEDEIAGLKELFKMIDTDNSGQITFEELKAGLKRVGANLKESEIYDLMQAVIIRISNSLFFRVRFRLITRFSTIFFAVLQF